MEVFMRSSSLKSWIDRLQAGGRYSLLRAEAVRDSGLTPNAVSKALRQAVKDGRIVRLKEYAYVIVPLEYRAAGAPPPSWFIHDLMAAMNLPYYVGLLSAAALHGASHQQPQMFQVMTDRSVRPIVAGRTKIQFFASKYVAQAAVQEMKTPTGLMRVSTPEATAVDLVRFAKAAGQLDHVAALIAELSHALNPKRLIAAARVVNDIPNAQRLGHILDRVRQRELADALHAWVESRIERTQLLRPGRSADSAKEDRRWRLLVNTPLEVEL
jgi:predicted transcriptional regulator of viral defense system